MRHIAYQRIGRTDDEPEDEGGLEPCIECDGGGGDGDGGPCLHCAGKAFFYGDEPMSKFEYDRFTEEMRYPS